jgi:hypothetical protein
MTPTLDVAGLVGSGFLRSVKNLSTLNTTMFVHLPRNQFTNFSAEHVLVLN